MNPRLSSLCIAAFIAACKQAVPAPPDAPLDAGRDGAVQEDRHLVGGDSEVSPPTPRILPDVVESDEARWDAPAEAGQKDAGVRPDSGQDAGPSGADAPSDSPSPADHPTSDASALDVPPGSIVCTDPEGRQRVVNPDTNALHCGGCNRRCCGRFCTDGRCTAESSPGIDACPLLPEEERLLGCYGEIAVSTSSNPNHCGACGRRCSENQRCVEGNCLSR
ncbi:MAG: hypothetical protein IPF99_42805 [Deltaproteobacteria bacterium]|jgi:hypothetical protein|nr:hypothetical protein [Deltaproteobacteria bacterium]MBP6835435.1 hypothetical protein [Deltaproteobacteria bacterium]